MLYSQLLGAVYKRLARSWGLAPSDDGANTFGASVPDWPEFPDSAEALQYLHSHYKLVILSNVDRLSFRASNTRLKVTFDAIYTAQDIGSYKPSDRNFDYLLKHLQDDFGFGKADILHVAQSLFHDHAPANRAGLASAWIDRRHTARGWGSTMAPPGTPRYDSSLAIVDQRRGCHLPLGVGSPRHERQRVSIPGESARRGGDGLALPLLGRFDDVGADALDA